MPTPVDARVRGLRLACLMALGMTLAAGPAPAAPKRAPDAAPPPVQALQPHRAVYKMTLESARSGSGVTGAQGVMLYRFSETCHAWAAETNVYLRLRYTEGPEVNSTWSFVSFEDKGGLGYRFRLRHERDGEVVEALNGTATLDDAGGAGRALFKGAGKDGADETMALPAGTLFPTAHLARVIGAAQEGKHFLPELVFDGAGMDNPYRITASIGGARLSEGAAAPKPAEKSSEGKTLPGLGAVLSAAGLKARPAWPVRLAFFPIRSRDAQPDFEIGVDYRPDGIAERVLQDYGSFAIDMAPAEIELLKRPDC